jgi:hypothetical protein
LRPQRNFGRQICARKHHLATKTVLQRSSIEPTPLFHLFCGNSLDLVGFHNLAAKSPSKRESPKHFGGICDQIGHWNESLGIPFRDMIREEIAPSAFAQHKFESLRLARVVYYGSESLQNLFTLFRLPGKLRPCKHGIAQAIICQLVTISRS